MDAHPRSDSMEFHGIYRGSSDCEKLVSMTGKYHNHTLYTNLGTANNRHTEHLQSQYTRVWMGGLVFTIHLKFSPLFISLKFWVIHLNKTNYSLQVRKVAKKSDYSQFITFFFNSLKK